MGTGLSRLNRRQFLAGTSGLAVSTLLAACGDDDDDPTPTTDAAPAPQPTETPTTASPADDPTPTDPPTTGSPAEGSVASQIDTSNMRRGGTLIQGGVSEVRLINPVLTGDSTTARVASLIMDGLVMIDPDTIQPAPNLAESWDVSDDGLTYTFALKSGVLFHDGEPFTAEDVKFTFEAAMNPETTSPRAGTLSQRIASVEAPDETTVVFNMKSVVAPFLVQNAAHGIVPKHLLGELTPAEWISSEFNTNPVGTGAFKMREYRAGEGVTVERNPDYHGGEPPLDGFIYKVVGDSTVLYQQLKTGEVDFAGIEPDFVDDARQQSNFTTFIYDTLGFFNYHLNLDPERTPVFQDVEVRRALQYAIDREGILQSILNGLGSVAIGIYSPISWAYSPDTVPDDLRYEYDPTRANDLLDQAGWLMGSDGVREKGGQRLSFEMHSRAGARTTEGFLSVYQENWRAVGVEMTPVYVEGSVLDQLLDVTYDFEAIQTGFSGFLDPDMTIVWHSASYRAGFNNMKYDNPQVDALLDEGLATLDLEERKRIYAEMQNLILADAPAFVTHFRQEIQGVNIRVKNLIPNAVSLFFNPHHWYIEE